MSMQPYGQPYPSDPYRDPYQQQQPPPPPPANLPVQYPQSAPPYSAPPYSSAPYSGQPYSGQPYAVPPQMGAPLTAVPGYVVPYGYDPLTGQPLSDKSKVAAGLLQLLLGFIGIGGVGRLYAGNIGIGVTQLILSFVGWVLVVCTLGVGFILYFPLWLWFVIDGIVMLAGSPRDGQGRLLRS